MDIKLIGTSPTTRRLLAESNKIFTWLLPISCIMAPHAHGMDLKTALEITLHTNPEIAESAANKRAIDFEYEQARRLNRPNVIIEGRAGPDWVDSRTTRLLGNDEDVLFGRQASVTFQQNLMSFGRNNSERDRQASRSDAAAHRVNERSELVSLDVVQSYFDILRLRQVIDFADQNVYFHESIVSDIAQSVNGGVRSQADAQQSRERLSAALISRNETEEALEIAESNFMRLVGREIGATQTPQSVTTFMPASLAEALQKARRNNPTLKIAMADLDTARAEYRKSKADKRPTLGVEVSGRAGENIGGFKDTTNDVRAQLVFRHEFRGGIKSAAVQEHLNRVDEVRQRIMRLERNVDSLVREAWATRNSTRLRKAELQKQVSEGTNLLNSYQREFNVGRRSLLDILDSQSSLFQAQTSLVTAEQADSYAQYRILASIGVLLESLNLTPRHEGKANLRRFEDVEETPPAEIEPRRYPDHYSKLEEADFRGLATNLKVPVENVKQVKQTIALPPTKFGLATDETQGSNTIKTPSHASTASIGKPIAAKTVSMASYRYPNTENSSMASVSTPPPTSSLLPKTAVTGASKPTSSSDESSIYTTSTARTIAVPVTAVKTSYLSEPEIHDTTVKPLMVQKVSLDKFRDLKTRDGAHVNWKLKTIMLEGTLYMLE